MQYISYYDSPLGRLLLAADEEGLVGAWFEGQKYFARGLAKECEERETPALAAAKRWLDVYFLEESRIFPCLFICRGRLFRKKCGRSFAGSLMEKQRRMGKSRKRWRKGMGAPAYRHGPWAALSDIIRSLSSFRAIGWSARTGA